MNKTLFMLALVSLLSVGLMASTSYAAGTTGKSGFMMFNSFDLIGAPVKDSHGELMGIVDKVMVDSSGRAFAIINHGDYDLYGDGGVNTPVPLRELRISQTKNGHDTVVLKTDMEHLDFAPYLNPLKEDSRRYETSIDEYYGIQPRWTQSGTTGKSEFREFNSLHLVSAPVENSCGRLIGIVNEVMVDPEGHALVVINHGDYDIFGNNGVNTPVPFQELRISKAKNGQDIVFLKTDTEHLDSSPYLGYPLPTKSRRFEANVYEFYGIQPYWIGSGESSK